ncbi:sigma-54-dependent Fis family transcriptional regulator [Acidobacteria bacterium ACD]|nr:MAG: sigma-54-dependent Fis family transcriptional regulator [Acidobacteriota bacterium]MCE7956919.1 sigma-54-dependent Fis family transcriptional regulator [Acidobacteria bacterium ACB2]MDL1948926.1 sigma-54-dependent Fis family transcriptional regulator [Acidobacteria bacterium ACD]
MLGEVLRDEGYAAEAVETGSGVLDRLLDPSAERVDALFLDVWLPDLDGLTVLDRIRAAGLDLPVVVISGHANVETAVAAVKRGADDFLEKPLSLERVLVTLEKALERRALARERDALRQALERHQEEEPLLGDGPAMTRLKEEIRRAGASEARVLITGESGVGKELVARALHRASPRASGPFVEVNGAAIPDDLIESELFGHVKGSFTGATEDRKGKWEQADGGTLYLDEIGDMSPKVQAKILRAIQDGRITRVGGARTIATDVRIVAATNRDLPQMIAAGTFREDLYFRLAVVPLRVPTLAERPEDVPVLVRHFAARLARKRGRRPRAFTQEALDELSRRTYRGNVRELENLVERVLLMTEGPEVTVADLPPAGGVLSPAREEADLAPGQTLAEAREAFEKRVTLKALADSRGNVSRAAERLGLDRTTLHRKLRGWGVEAGRE